AWQELKKLLGNRINNGLEGNVSTKSIGDILDDELSGDRE
ncbi:antitoxin, partial [Escherichia coli]|nr:antitoxin [Escherichia coli]